MSSYIWEQQAQIEAIAAQIFARRGVDFAAAQRAGGWTNATWIAGGLALRIATQPGSDKIRRELRLAGLLPREVGYPVSVESGVTGGFEWNLSIAIPGRCLGEAWDGLSWAERATALRGLWRSAQAVHRVDPAAAAGLARERAWFNSTDPAEAEAALQRVTERGLFAPAQAAALRQSLDRFWSVLPSAPRVLCHGDLTLDNAIWRDGQVVSLLDFEYAVIAPVQLDLNNLLKAAFTPEEDPPAERHGRAMLHAAALELAQPALSQPNGPLLRLGYAILIELFLLELWLAHPEGEGPVEHWHPYRRLLEMAAAAL